MNHFYIPDPHIYSPVRPLPPKLKNTNFGPTAGPIPTTHQQQRGAHTLNEPHIRSWTVSFCSPLVFCGHHMVGHEVCVRVRSGGGFGRAVFVDQRWQLGPATMAPKPKGRPLARILAMHPSSSLSPSPARPKPAAKTKAKAKGKANAKAVVLVLCLNWC